MGCRAIHAKSRVSPARTILGSYLSFPLKERSTYRRRFTKIKEQAPTRSIEVDGSVTAKPTIVTCIGKSPKPAEAPEEPSPVRTT